MLQTGIVKKLNTHTAEVEIVRSSACGDSCASCGLCAGQNAVVEAENTIGAKAGDTVVMDMADKKVLYAAFLVYIVPIIALIAGYFAGAALFNGEAAGVAAGFIAMALAFSVIILTDRRRKKRYTPSIVKIINGDGGTV